MPTRNHNWLWLAIGLPAAGMLLYCCIGIVGVVLIRLRGPTPPAVPDTITYQEDVPLGTGGTETLVWDIARPKAGPGPFPAVVCIHGGGWRGGDKSSFRMLIQTLAQQGYVAVTVRYRFAPAHRFPAQLEDVKCAVRALRAKAGELNVDPDRIGAVGGSAGGHLALLLGTTDADSALEGSGGYTEHSSRVQAVGSIAGPVDLGQPFPSAVEVMLRDLTGAPPGPSPEAARASPLTYLTADDPPILVVHGTLDELVPYSQATSLIEACQRVGVPARLITIPDGGHGAGGQPQDWTNANAELIEFLDAHLKPSVPTP